MNDLTMCLLLAFLLLLALVFSAIIALRQTRINRPSIAWNGNTNSEIRLDSMEKHHYLKLTNLEDVQAR